MTSYLFTNVRVLDATGAPPFSGEVLVVGNRIKAVARVGAAAAAPDAEVIDGGGATLMPGLLDVHTHMSFTNGFSNPLDTVMIPPEDHTLITMKHARLLLDHGFTSCFGAATAKARLDVAIRNAINAGDIPGPRFRASSLQLCPTGGFGDERLTHFDNGNHIHVMCCDGPEQFRIAARTVCREGVDVIKIVPSGSSLGWGADDLAEDTLMTEDEVRAVTAVAKQRNRRVAAHARSAESVKICLRAGVDVIYHATLADAEALDLFEARKDTVFYGPSIGLPVTRLEKDTGVLTGPHATPRARLEAEIVAVSAVSKALYKRGVRVLPGGDYGFVSSPHGENARDIEYFVRLFDMTPMQSICCATSHAGALMGLPGELGLVKEGYLADLLLVDGDPLADVSILQHQNCFLGIMKDGRFHKRPVARRSMRQAAE